VTRLRSLKPDLATGNKRVLSDRELRFVEEYCVDLDPTLAAQRAGIVNPSDLDNGGETGRKTGRMLIRDTDIRDAVDARLAALDRRAKSNAMYVRERLVEVVERCMQKEQVMEKGIDENGKVAMVPTGEWAFNAQGANKALELLGRHHGMFGDKVVITIEHELKALSQGELDARIRRIMEEHKAIDMVPGADGVYAVIPAIPQITQGENEGGDEQSE
jgi:phage terminase small subunit